MLIHVQLLSYQAPLSMGFFRQEYQTGLPFPPLGNLPDPWIKPTNSSQIQVIRTTESSMVISLKISKEKTLILNSQTSVLFSTSKPRWEKTKMRENQNSFSFIRVLSTGDSDEHEWQADLGISLAGLLGGLKFQLVMIFAEIINTNSATNSVLSDSS